MDQLERAADEIGFGSARVIEVEPGTCSAGAWANLTITRWQNRATGPAVERVARVSREIRAAYPNGISSVHLLCEGTGLPTPEGREGLMRLMNSQVEQLACVAIVIGGSGFWASAIRSMITGLRSMSSRAYELKLMGSIDEVAAWVPGVHTRRTGVAIRNDSLARALAVANQWDARTQADSLTDVEC